MTEGNVHKQEVAVRDLATSSVTFFPTRANVVRDVNDVIIKVRPCIPLSLVWAMDVTDKK